MNFHTENTTVLDLSFTPHSILQDSWVEIVDNLKINTTITYLNFARIVIGHSPIITIESICDIIRNNSTISHLDLSQNKLKLEHIETLSNAIAENQTLISLNLSNNPIGADGIIVLSNVLRHNTSITNLDLSACMEIDEDDIILINPFVESTIYLANTLIQRNILTNLFYTCNDINDEGVIALSKAPLNTLTLLSELITDESLSSLGSNSSIQNLDLVSNLITSNGLIKLANALKNNSTLKRLYLVSNQIEDDGKQALTDALVYNTNIESIIMYGDIYPGIRDALKKNKEKRKIFNTIYNNVESCKDEFDQTNTETNYQSSVLRYNFLQVLETLPR